MASIRHKPATAGVKSLLAAGRDLSELPGIGKDLAGQIAEIVKTGHFALLDALKKKLPGELGEMLAFLAVRRTPGF
jgi:DNA polymerase (family X)